MAKPKLIGHSWSFSDLWNEAMLSLPERPMQKRNYIYASELGMPFCDRYLKMHAVPYTNPPNLRSLRKFVSGDIWEGLVAMVLTACGVLKYRQLRGKIQLSGCLEVSGKCDFVAGGVVDWNEARAKAIALQTLWQSCADEAPRFIMHAISHIINAMEKSYGNNPLKEMILELKAVSSFVSEKIEKSKRALPHNVMQCFHYVAANKELDEAKLVYICKDDNIMSEFEIMKDRAFAKFYKQDVEEMTGWYNQTAKNPLKSIPPIEAPVLFDQDLFRFEKNLQVEYSPYLTMLYGIATPDEYRRMYQAKVSSWNRVFKRCVNGDKITDKNKVAMSEVKKYFPDWDKWVYKAKSVGAFQKEETEKEEV